MNHLKRTVLALVAATSLTGLAACSTTYGTQGGADAGGYNVPNTETRAYAKDPIGMAQGDHRQWVTMDMKNQCKRFGECTPQEIAQIKRGCDVARDAYGIPIHVPAFNGGLAGGIAVAGGVALGSLTAGFSEATMLTNMAFNGPVGVTQYAYNGAQQGAGESFTFDQKCGGSMLSASGAVFLDSRPVSKSSPEVIHLLPSGQVKPVGYQPSAAELDGPVINTSQMSPGTDRDLINKCQQGISRNDPFAFDKINQCMRTNSDGKRWLVNQDPPQASASSPPPQASLPAPKGHNPPARRQQPPNNRWTDK